MRSKSKTPEKKEPEKTDRANTPDWIKIDKPLSKSEMRRVVVRELATLQNKELNKRDKKPDLNALLDRATDVLGDREVAARWLGTPVKALGYKTPVDVAATEGDDRVLAVLDQVENGVW